MFQDAVTDKFNSMRSIGADDILAALGLQRRRTMAASMLPMISGFAAGALAGAAVALLFAPRPGHEMRRELKGRASDMTRRVSEAAGGLIEDARNALPIGGEKSGSEEEQRQHLQPPRPSYSTENNGRTMEHGNSVRTSSPLSPK